ncbi:hypothetical protein TNCV_4041611 [Trichonephila clavipes]|nr:hypothetical protein TNCV_4041611 [Trichonephila clavipes]
MTPPPRDTLVSRKLMTGFAKRIFTGRECTEMSFGMSCIVGCQREKSVPQRPPGRLVSIPPAIAPFHRIGIDLLGRFPKSAHETNG